MSTSRVVLHSILNGVVLFFLTFRWHAGTTVWKDFYLVSVPVLQVVHISKVVLMFKNKRQRSGLLKVLKGLFNLYLHSAVCTRKFW